MAAEEYKIVAMSEEAMEDDDSGGGLLALLNVTGTVTTILMFLTGVRPCREVCFDARLYVANLNIYDLLPFPRVIV